MRRQIGQNVKAELIRLGLSHEDLGRVLNLSQSQATRRLSGQIAFSAAEIARIAHDLKIPADRMLEVPANLMAGAA